MKLDIRIVFIKILDPNRCQFMLDLYIFRLSKYITFHCKYPLHQKNIFILHLIILSIDVKSSYNLYIYVAKG